MKTELFLLLLAAVVVSGGVIEIRSETACPVEVGRSPVRIESCGPSASGDLSVLVSKGVPFGSRYWSVELGPEGDLLSCEEIPMRGTVLSTSPLEDSREVYLVACAIGGDTLWTCPLEGTNADFIGQSVVAELGDGGYLVNSPPDCQTAITEIQRISPDGRTVFHFSLGTDYLLDLEGQPSEIYPKVLSLSETAGGDVLLGGSVSQWLTSPDAWFVCLLEGSTGEPLWKITGSGLGEARLLHAVETESGRIIAVGETAESVVPEGMAYSIWGSRRPLTVLLDRTGALLDQSSFQPEMTDSFLAVAEFEYGDTPWFDGVLPLDRFLIAGADSLSGGLTLVHMVVSLE